ncbi:MAG: potassium channel family protein, partial [Gaiellaceae bacterium]
MTSTLALGRLTGLEIFGRFRLSFALLLGTAVYGIVGYRAIEEWSLLDSFYMTVITLSTVGFREVQPLSNGGQLFTVSLILFGLVTVFSALAVVTELIATGELGKWAHRRRDERRIARLRNHFVVAGYGRVGRFACEEFSRERIPFVVVDPDSRLGQELEASGIPYVVGDASEDDVLRDAGVDEARGLICAADSDAANVSITLTARALNPNLTIVARASRPEADEKLVRAGADRAVSAAALGGVWLAHLALRPAVNDFFDVVTRGDDLGFEEIPVTPGSPLEGKTVEEVRAAYARATVLAIRRDGRLR